MIRTWLIGIAILIVGAYVVGKLHHVDVKPPSGCYGLETYPC